MHAYIIQWRGHSHQPTTAAFVGPVWASFINAAFGNASELFVVILGVINNEDELVRGALCGITASALSHTTVIR